MKEEIINRVANSKLVTLDLEDFYPKGERISIDISQWLFEGIVLKEKDFREAANTHDWSQYSGCFVALYCSTEAIIPGWAYMFLSLKLAPFAEKTTVGTLEELETVLFSEIIENMPVDSYTSKSVIIKGCSHKPIPASAYVLLAQKLQAVAQSIMYGEACSSVPLYKKK
ncbi:uncharacterized protein DUF2480 [Ulvibacter sp. MAR_2010_11]|uniref:DUF2480 family protein n=1 Tax=Ulvibacter sp. MAR_2010_11 TaxID=1250229 RepID=UPI000C2CCAFD|nr:DUF2480 family protein [Ulvibacter sp. MAR_2010_11]PKA82781.1 uncharacterized protein DUF2480 [Ulvibacter sp. MAR_2010_11]